MKARVAKKIENQFRYVGLTCLSHCEGEDWTPVWDCPTWETQPMSAKRARYIWATMRRIVPELFYERTPAFVAGRKYQLRIEDDTLRVSRISYTMAERERDRQIAERARNRERRPRKENA